MVNSADWCLAKGYLICFQQSGTKMTGNKAIAQKDSAHSARLHDVFPPWATGQAAFCRLTLWWIRGHMPQVCVVETARRGCHSHSKHYPSHASHCAFKMYVWAHQVPYPPNARPPGFPWQLGPRGINTAGCLDSVEAESQAVSEILRGPAPRPSLGTAADTWLGHLVS